MNDMSLMSSFSPATQNALRAYGWGVCTGAYKLQRLEGRTLWEICSTLSLSTKSHAQSAVIAGREIETGEQTVADVMDLWGTGAVKNASRFMRLSTWLHRRHVVTVEHRELMSGMACVFVHSEDSTFTTVVTTHQLNSIRTMWAGIPSRDLSGGEMPYGC